MESPSVSPNAKSKYYNEEIDIRKEVSVLIRKEDSLLSLGFAALPSIVRKATVSPSKSPAKLFGAAQYGNLEKVKSYVENGISVININFY